MKAIAPVTTPVLVELTDGQPTTTSLDVAAHFSKQHKTVLRAIANLECSPEFNQHNFAPIEYTDTVGRKYTQYRMTRDGFTFLCMGFTGKEAAKWKEAYIDAFNRLEHAAAERNTLPVAQGAAFEQRALNGHPILIAELEGKLWFSAGNLCTALNLGTSDRVVRSLVAQHKRKLQHGRRDLWMVDVIGAQRAADYCKPEVAGDYRQWLQRLLAERTGSESAQGWAGEKDSLHNLPVQTEQALSQKLLRSRFLMYFDLTGEMHIQAIDPEAGIFKRDQLASFISDPQGAPRSSLPDILEAVSHRMKSPI
ncbi:Rha family transcriptional regulator [Pseudomonas huaxiensis]|uniref:Rha family transcriptional regulator n=1 Tax=Pseudomonas huaxiensis TaxID=2213017 RepID=UPI000DA6C53C|nr:Rha family transcriptional regulator [Pseudomonas huaxiensis]